MLTAIGARGGRCFVASLFTLVVVCVATEGADDRTTDVKDEVVVAVGPLLVVNTCCCCIGRDAAVTSEGGIVVPTM